MSEEGNKLSIKNDYVLRKQRRISEEQSCPRVRSQSQSNILQIVEPDRLNESFSGKC